MFDAFWSIFHFLTENNQHFDKNFNKNVKFSGVTYKKYMNLDRCTVSLYYRYYIILFRRYSRWIFKMYKFDTPSLFATLISFFIRVFYIKFFR